MCSRASSSVPLQQQPLGFRVRVGLTLRPLAQRVEPRLRFRYAAFECLHVVLEGLERIRLVEQARARIVVERVVRRREAERRLRMTVACGEEIEDLRVRELARLTMCLGACERLVE